MASVNCWYDTHSSSSNMTFFIYSSSVWLTDVCDLTFHNTPCIYIMRYLSRRLSREYIDRACNCSQYDSCAISVIFRMKFHWTCSSTCMSPFLEGFHSWQQYSSLERIRDFHSVSMGTVSLVGKVLRIHPHICLAVSVVIMMCRMKVPSLLMVTPKSFISSTSMIGLPSFDV